MKKTLLMKSLAILVLLFPVVLLGCSGTDTKSSEGEVIELSWYIGEAEGHAWTIAANNIADEVAVNTNGEVVMKIYPNASLGTQAEAIDMLRTGSLAIATSGPSILASFYEQVQVYSLPYVFDNPQQAYGYFESDASQEMFNKIILDKSGVRTLDVWYFGDRNLTINGDAPTDPQDLSGISVRSMDTPISKSVVAALGANPIPINISELYLGLQTGVVEGQENPVPLIINQKFFEVQDNLILTKHSVHMGTVHVSEQIWSSLSDEHRMVISDLLAKYRPEIEKMIIEQTEAGLVQLKESGMNIVEPDTQAFKDSATKIIEENFLNDPEWKKVIDGLNEFKANN